jgi:dCMP deaminase
MTKENDIKYLKTAFENARDNGTDPSTQNGAVIVNADGWIVGEGANHFPKGVVESYKRWERPLKYQFVEHAERNAIFNAAKDGRRLAGAVMYCPWYACADCSRAIIQAGISQVVGHQKCFDLTPDHWKDSIANAFLMFEEAGVKTRTISDDIGVVIRFNGEQVYF